MCDPGFSLIVGELQRPADVVIFTSPKEMREWWHLPSASACLNALQLSVEVSPLDPDVHFRRKLEIIVLQVVALILRAVLVLDILSIP